MAYPISVITGDGIGCEVVSAAVRVLEATGISFAWEYVLAGEQAFQKYGDPLPEDTLDSIRKNQVALKGPLTNFVAKGYPGPNRGLRNRLGLFAAVKRAESFEGVESRYPGVDLAVIREVREDTYAGAEQQVGADAAVAIKFITGENSRKVARFAMEFAVKNGRKKVVATAKATALKLTDGLFYKCAQEVAAEYPS
jgi:isocitrate dehydrogenase (NAD+)